MKNSILLLIVAFLWSKNCFCQDIFVSKLTGNNPTSLTDAVFVGKKDSVIVSKYNGDISLVINNKSTKKIASLKDEVYALAYNSKSKELIASTLEKGVFIIDFPTGKIKKILSMNKSWTNTLNFTSDLKYLVAQNQYNQPVVWEVNKNYQKVELDKQFPLGRIIEIENGIATILTVKEILKWDIVAKKEKEKRTIELSFFSDIDEHGNVLTLLINEIMLNDYKEAKVLFKLKHPDYKRYYNNNGVKTEVNDELSLAISCAKFCKNYILSSGTDKSLRVWDKKTGQLIKTFWEHNGTVNKIAINNSKTQIVTIDLKGGINFKDFTSLIQ